MSHQELQVLFDGAGAEDLADRLIDFVESELEGEATASLYDPKARDWPGDDMAALHADDVDDDEVEDLDDDEADASDDEDDDDAEADPDDLEDEDPVLETDDLDGDGSYLVTISRSCFEPSGSLSLDDVELRAAAFLEWLDEETKHSPNVRVDLWIGTNADSAQALEELDAELLLELLEVED